ALLHVAGLDRAYHAALSEDALHLLARAGRDLGDLGLDHAAAVEDVRVVENVRLVGEDLLDAQAPLLGPRPRKTQGLVPCRKLERPTACVARQRDTERLEHDARHVVLRLRLGEAERVDLDAVAEAPELRVGHLVAIPGDLVPELPEGAHLADLLDE